MAIVIGNIIQQSANTENPHLISFGAEGYRWPANELYLIHNTLVDDQTIPGFFLRVKPGATTIRIINNLLVGAVRWDLPDGEEQRNNFRLKHDGIDRSGAGTFRLKPGTRASGITVDAGTAHGGSLTPSRQYQHPRHTIPIQPPVRIPGAVQSIVWMDRRSQGDASLVPVTFGARSVNSARRRGPIDTDT